MKYRLGSLIAATLLLFSLSGAAAAADASDDDGDYRVVMVATSGTNWQAIRYHEKNGKAWKLDAGKWSEMKDTGTIPASKYRVDMVALMQDWGALRMDVRSGRSWLAVNGAWSEIPEPTP